MTCTQNNNTQGLCTQYTLSAATNQITTSGYTYDASSPGPAARTTLILRCGKGLGDEDATHSYQYDAAGRMILVDAGTRMLSVYN